MMPFIVLLLLLVGLVPDALVGQHPAESHFAARVSQRRLQQTVHDLVSIGNRMGGTKSGDRSARYLHQRFKSYGLNSAIVEEPDRLTFTNDQWSLKVEQPRSLRKLIKNEWLAGFAPSISPQKARLVYLEPDDSPEEGALDHLIVLTGRHIDNELYQRLVRAGVVCILTYAPSSPDKYQNWSLISSLRPSHDNVIPVFNISYSNGIRLKSELERGTPIVMSFMTRTTISLGKPKTVVATLLGERPEYFIVCAHGDSDSGGPGADDNASGVAGVLEVARTMQSLVRDGLLPRPKKTIKFIVWGIEYASTIHYVQTHADSLDEILGVLNYDEIGTGVTRNCLYFESNDLPHNEVLLRTLNTVAEQYVDKPGFWLEATTNPSQGGTDSYVFLPDFLDRLKLPDVKIPSVTVFTAAWDEAKTLPQTEGWSSKAWKGHPDSVTIDYSAYYHSSLDVPRLTTDKEPFNMTWAVKAVGLALLRLAW